MTNSPTAPLDPVRLQEGDPAPNFQLYDDQGNTVSLGDFSGQRVVLYFYPRALTPGCTTQACDFQAALPLLDDAEIKVIGISPDKPGKLAQFRKTHHLTFPLLSDPDKDVMTKYGAFGEKNSYGRIIKGVIRSTFVISPNGKIESTHYNAKATGHVGRMLKTLAIEMP